MATCPVWMKQAHYLGINTYYMYYDTYIVIFSQSIHKSMYSWLKIQKKERKIPNVVNVSETIVQLKLMGNGNPLHCGEVCV